MLRTHVGGWKLGAAGQRMGHLVVDVGSSAKWSGLMQDCSPCLTASRMSGFGGHWLLRQHRLVTEKEVCRLQGIPDAHVDYHAAKVRKCPHNFLAAVGKAMTTPWSQRLSRAPCPLLASARRRTWRSPRPATSSSICCGVGNDESRMMPGRGRAPHTKALTKICSARAVLPFRRRFVHQVS